MNIPLMKDQLFRLALEAKFIPTIEISEKLDNILESLLPEMVELREKAKQWDDLMKDGAAHIPLDIWKSTVEKAEKWDRIPPQTQIRGNSTNERKGETMIITLSKKECDDILMKHIGSTYAAIVPEGHAMEITRKYTDDIEIEFYPIKEEATDDTN
jgi:hypothetical protein